MRATEFITELRKNPDQNPKVSVSSAIEKRLDNAYALDSAPDVYNLFVSFTSVDKLGINPSSTYETPLGIYSYPASFVHKRMYNGNNAKDSLPFAGDQPFANIFSAKGNIIDISTISSTEVNNLYRKIGEFFYQERKKQDPARYSSSQGWKDAVDWVEEVINHAPRRAKFADSPGGHLWYVTMRIAQDIGRWHTRTAVIWNKLWRSIGVDGCIDSKGVGIIHTSEPVQAVFFHIGAVDNVERIANKYAARDLDNREAYGTKIDKFNRMSEEEVLTLLQTSPLHIRYLRYPSTEAQWVAFKSIYGDPGILKHIRNPAEEIVLASVEAIPTSIRFVKNPPLSAQQLVINKAIENYPHIQNPHPDITKQYNTYRAQEEDELRAYMAAPAPK